MSEAFLHANMWCCNYPIKEQLLNKVNKIAKQAIIKRRSK